LTANQYNKYVDYLQLLNKVQWRHHSNEMKQRYYLKGNLRGNQIATYENVFDIIDGTHVKLGHVRECRTMYNHINKVWYGVPEKVIKYIEIYALLA
jgi:hypothetical protein